MKIHNWLVPTKKNKFHPHALRPLGLLVFLALFVGIHLIYNITSARQVQVLGYATSISVDQLAALTNQERASSGLAPLNFDSQLSSAATAKANYMFANNYWAHVAPDGTTPWSFINAAGYSYSDAGENLAKDFNTSAGVMSGWMGSAEHRANILSSTYSDMGFAVVDGTLLGAKTTLVVAMYATRVVAPAPAPVQTQRTVPVTTSEPETPVAPSKPAPVISQPVTETQEPPFATQSKPAPVQVTTATTQAPGQVEGMETSLPVRVYTSMNWGQKASLVLISVLILLFIMKHTLVWRQQRRGLRHIWLRAHPLSQVAMLTAAFIVTLFSGTGIIL